MADSRRAPAPARAHGTDEPIVWYEGSGTSNRRFLQADERGSVVAISDSSGTKLGINTYDDYGIPGAGNQGRFQYTGQTWYPELGMYNYKARIYSPTMGRFMQTDPIGYGDGANWYNYAHGDPVNGSDPSGMGDVGDDVTHRTQDAGGDQTIVVTGSKSSGINISSTPSFTINTGGPLGIGAAGGGGGGGGGEEIVVTAKIPKPPKPKTQPKPSPPPPPTPPPPPPPPYRLDPGGKIKLDPNYEKKACDAYNKMEASAGHIGFVAGLLGSVTGKGGAIFFAIVSAVTGSFSFADPPPGCDGN